MDGSVVSIVVPVYKVEPYLRECVESIRNQKYSNIELILVDDGSPDKCGEICDEYAKIDSRVKVVHKMNGGLSSARNAGIDVASGEYLMFVDSDDFIAPEMVSEMYDAITRSKVDIVSCGYSYYLNGKLIPHISKYDVTKGAILGSREYLGLILSGDLDNASWNKIYRRDVFAGVRFLEGRNNEDLLMLYNLLDKCHSILCIPKCYYFYRMRAESIVNSNKPLVIDCDANYKLIINGLEEKGDAEILECAIRGIYRIKIDFCVEYIMGRYSLYRQLFELYRFELRSIRNVRIGIKRKMQAILITNGVFMPIRFNRLFRNAITAVAVRR